MANLNYGSNSLNVGGTAIPTFLPALITAALTVVFMFLPWVHIPYADVANLAGGLAGESMGISPDYSVLGVFGLLNDALSMVSPNTEIPGEITALRAEIIFWGISIAVVVIGAILYVTGRKELLIVGCAMAAIVAVIWCFGLNHYQNMIAQETYGIQIFSLPPWPIATIVASVVTIFLAVSLKPAGIATGAFGGQTAAMPNPNQYRAPVPGSTPYVAQQPQAAPVTQQAPIAQPAPAQNYYPQPAATAPVSTPAPAQAAYMDTACFCPNCGAEVRVSVPAQHCMVNITCRGCGAKFPMEVHPR